VLDTATNEGERCGLTGSGVRLTTPSDVKVHLLRCRSAPPTRTPAPPRAS